MTDIAPAPVVTEPVVTPPVAVDGMAIVTSPTKIAPLTAADGVVYIVQVMNAVGGTIFPSNAATWTHNADSSLDIYDANACLVASFPSGQWTNVQLVPAPTSAA
jgi:hypothetical protein